MGEAKQQISEGQNPANAGKLQSSSLQPGVSAKLNRFVLLVSSISTRPAKLLKGLYDRKIAVRIVHDAALAMAELELFRAQVLIVHEAAAVSSLESLLNAVRIYHPHVLCWRHEPAGPDGRERLSPFQCSLTPQASPRFTPAPADLHPQPASSPTGTTAKRQHDASKTGQHARESLNSSQDASQSKSPSASHDGAKHVSGTVNGITHGHANGHAYNNGHALESDATQPPPQLSWGQRLANASGDRTAQGKSPQASDAFSPLLTPEEIELLRGPIEDGP